MTADDDFAIEVLEWARDYRNLYRASQFGPVTQKQIETRRKHLFAAIDAYEAEIADAPDDL